MKYYSGITALFVPEPEGTVYAESVSAGQQIWEASSYSNDQVTEVTKEQADIIKTWPGWEG